MGREREREVQQYTVEQLVAVNPYNPDILPDLENYVNDQVSSLPLFHFTLLFRTINENELKHFNLILVNQRTMIFIM